MLVLLFHGFSYLNVKSDAIHAAAEGHSLITEFLLNGDRGVELFFVLSGFILCLPFARQYITGSKPVELKRYYLRRVTRLEPPYFIAMTGIMLLQLLMHVRPAAELLPSWLASLVYSHNIIFRHTPLITVVAWSLEIEIQFYVLAPVLFRVLKLTAAIRRSVLLLSIGAMVIIQAIWPAPGDLLSLYGFLQYFLTGILLADLYVTDTAKQLFNSRSVAIVSLLCLLAIAFLPLKSKLGSASDSVEFWAKLIFPYVIGLFYYTILRNDVVKRIFSIGYIPIIGGMCYSIYLLHYPIISAVGRYTQHWHFSGSFVVDIIIHLSLLTIPVLLISAIFYKYIERPFMSGKWLNMLLREPVKKD